MEYNIFLKKFFLGIKCAFLLSTLLGSVTAFSQPAQDEENTEVVKEDNTEINVKNADISTIIRIFSKKTKRNYILDDRVKGRVSIYLPGKVSPEESLRILDSVLALKGFTSVPISENLWKIVPSKEAKQSTIPTKLDSSEENPTPAVVTRLVNLKFVSAQELQQLLQQLISPDGLINSYPGTNSLIIIDSEDNIQRLIELVDALDVPSTDRDMTIIPVKYAEAVDLAQKLSDLLGAGSGSTKSGGSENSALDLLRQRPPQGPGAPQSAAASAQSNNAATVGKEPKIIADERTNSIIVVADEEMTARIKALITKLDSKVDLAGSRFFVYHCQHADAEELAGILSGLGGGSTSGTSGTGSRRSGAFGSDFDSGFGGDSFGSGGSSFGRRSSSSRGGSSGLFGSTRSSQSRMPGQSRNREQSSGPTTATIGDNISITADPATNSLVINATRTDYEKLLELIRQLDVKRRQVIVEAMLLEVSIDRDQSFGADFFTSGGGVNGGFFAKRDVANSTNPSIAGVLTDPTATSEFTAAAASAGTLTLPGGIQIPSQSILVAAAQSNNKVNVLSAPTILATDNEPAEIVVGQNVPFITNTSRTEENLNNIFNSVDRQDVGITLRITPQISSEAYVTMSIFTEVSDVIDSTRTDPNGPTTTVRTSETTVIAKDGQMIVTGGLLSDDASESEHGVPFFKDIPVFGQFFKDSANSRSKRNLLIFITPRIVQDQVDAREITTQKANVAKNDIVANDIYPNRADVLNSPNIDKVIEPTDYNGAKPSTILPPEKSKEEKQSSPENRPLSSDTSPKMPQSNPLSSDNSPGVIELRVAPKLKTTSNKSTNTDELKRLAKEYIVAKTDENTKNLSTTPFTGNGNSIFGIVIPEGTSHRARQFFATGNNIGYQTNDNILSVQILGKFRSANEAELMYDQIGWYTLSPYEIMRLGEKPWIKQ